MVHRQTSQASIDPGLIRGNELWCQQFNALIGRKFIYMCHRYTFYLLVLVASIFTTSFAALYSKREVICNLNVLSY